MLGTPAQSDARFDRLIVLRQPVGKAPHGVDSTRGGAQQPGIEVFRLPLTDQGGKVLGELDCLGQFSRLGMELGELLRLSVGALLRVPEDEPGSPARGQGLAQGLRHGGQRLPGAAVRGGQTLGLPQPAGIGGHTGIAPWVALLLEVTKEAGRCVAARIPALEERRFVRI